MYSIAQLDLGEKDAAGEMAQSRAGYVPAPNHDWLTPLYDPLLLRLSGLRFTGSEQQPFQQLADALPWQIWGDGNREAARRTLEFHHGSCSPAGLRIELGEHVRPHTIETYENRPLIARGRCGEFDHDVGRAAGRVSALAGFLRRERLHGVDKTLAVRGLRVLERRPRWLESRSGVVGSGLGPDA